jgi:hypothetical protein
MKKEVGSVVPRWRKPKLRAATMVFEDEVGGISTTAWLTSCIAREDAALSLRTGTAAEIRPSPEVRRRDNNADVPNLRRRLLDRTYQLSHAANKYCGRGSGSDPMRGFPNAGPWDLRALPSPPICSPKISLLVAMLEFQIRIRTAAGNASSAAHSFLF